MSPAPRPAPYGVDPSGNPLDRYGLSRPVWLLGWVSFFTDTASEMVYPLLPLFLTRVLGAGAMSLGVIEGVAEAANSLLKIVSGWLADRWGTQKRLVLAGYSLSSLARPLISFVTSWLQVLGLRFVDRLGKGIRTSPRDAMLAKFAPEKTRGRVYGFHRAMDHAGAVAGPLVATAFLYFRHEDYRTLFGLTLIPGIIVIVIILALPEKVGTVDRPSPVAGRQSGSASSQTTGEQRPATTSDQRPATTGDPRPATSGLPSTFHLAIAVIFLFSLGNASDAFLLLRLSDLGVASFFIPLMWSALHLVKMTSSVVGGAMSDRFGRRTLIALGYLWYAAIYFAFGYFEQRSAVIAIFLAYGVYFGLTEGVEKAWIADMAPAARRGTAFGIYNAAIGFGGLAASLLFGFLWTEVSPRAAFVTGAALALAASVLLVVAFRQDKGSGMRDAR